MTWWRKNWWRMAISVTWDALDFTIGRVPVFGTVFDAIGGFLGLYLWGGIGGVGFVEILDFSDQLDGFVPILTLTGLYRMYKN